MPFDSDTSLGGPLGRFPSTRPSLLAAATDNDIDRRREALGGVVAIYWKPIYKYIRVHWKKTNDEAKDLTQSFLSDLLTDTTLQAFDPARASFRTYLRICIDGCVANANQSADRLKRGGGTTMVSIDDAQIESEMPAAGGLSMEEFFHREWQREMFAQGIDDLRRLAAESGKTAAFRLFESHDLADDTPSYKTLALQFGVTETTVTNHLAWARRELRRFVLARVASVSGSSREFSGEVRALFGETRKTNRTTQTSQTSEPE